MLSGFPSSHSLPQCLSLSSVMPPGPHTSAPQCSVRNHPLLSLPSALATPLHALIRHFGLLLLLLLVPDVTAGRSWRCLMKHPHRPCINATIGYIQGFRQTVNSEYTPAKSVSTFLGVPFALPPIGKLRFRRPVPFSSRSGRRRYINATAYKPPCWQLLDTNYADVKAQKIWQLPDLPAMSEDCLYLNLWIPEMNDEEKEQWTDGLPIMVWVYGGSFSTGTASLDIYDGQFLAAHQRVIVASMNYRLGPLGFLYLGTDDAPGNMGLWDQREAFKWLKLNAHTFGGDPNRITLFGESAGAVSVGLHVLSPYSHNYFTNAIMESGSALCSWGTIPRDRAFNRSLTFIQEFVGCRNGSLVAKMRCLRSKTNREIDHAHLLLYSSSMFFHVPLPPVLDGVFLPYGDDFETLKFFKPTGAFMFGMNKNEASYFLLYKFIPMDQWNKGKRSLVLKRRQDFQEKLRTMFEFDKEPGSATMLDFALTLTAFEYEKVNETDGQKKFLDMLESVAGDSSFKCPTVMMAERALKARPPVNQQVTPVYFYQFNHRTKSLPWPEWMGTPHGYEIEYIFGMPFSEKFQRLFYKFNAKERLLSHLVMTYWANFARYGDPNISMKGGLSANEPNFAFWAEFNRRQFYIIFGDDGQLSHSFRPLMRKCRFWDIHFRRMVDQGRKMIERKANASCPTNSFRYSTSNHP